ncbi:DUF5821 family protein [Halobaculum sp. MBLA0147]|uniref:transcriptional regulator TbsP domain-containing protein n=1 Tax=Halobaculum sp. MBLA0147 TaxID=3079934 RepID=UPI0035265BBC
MSAGFVPDGPGETVSELFAETDGVVYLTNATADDVEELVDAAEAFDGDLPTLRVLGIGEELRKVRRDFLVASRAADLVDEGYLALGEREPTQNTTVLVSESSLYAPVHVDTARGTLLTDDAEFVAETYEWCERNWERAESFDLRTPPLSVVRDTMDAEFRPDAREDFDRVLDGAAEARDTTELDEVVASLLVAAKHELLHYDVSKWGEDIGLASKATFSRKKGKLEEMGVITTEKETLEMGRPRQRLVLTDDYREEVDRNGLSTLLANVVY